MIIVTGALISGTIFFSKIVQISSLQQPDFRFSPMTTFSTTVSSTSVKLNFALFKIQAVIYIFSMMFFNFICKFLLNSFAIVTLPCRLPFLHLFFKNEENSSNFFGFFI